MLASVADPKDDLAVLSTEAEAAVNEVDEAVRYLYSRAFTIVRFMAGFGARFSDPRRNFVAPGRDPDHGL